MKLLKFCLCVFLCLTLNNNEVQSQYCNSCECKPNKMTFSCDCTRKTTIKSCSKERSHKLIIANEELLISVGNVNLHQIEEFDVHNITIPNFHLVKSVVTLESLRTFILKYCETKKIDENAFENMRKLIRLEIENNYISSLESDIFIFVEKLEILRLRSNSISSLSEGIFRKLYNLTDISLDNNKIQTLPKNLFKTNTNLKYINLSNNKIDFVDEELFATNYNIEKIYLHNNVLRKLPASIFENHASIYEIDLSNNKIQILPNGLFKNIQSLRIIKLDNNEINLIEKNVFYNNSKLEAIFLNNNKLKYIEANIIKNAGNLMFLNLTNNTIKCDCVLIQFYTILKTNRISAENVQCTEPNTLKNKKFSKLQLEDFVCPAKIVNCSKIISNIKNKNNFTTFACQYYGYPEPEVSWIFNKEKIANNNINYNMTHNYLNNGTYTYWSNLTVFNVTAITKGQYKLEIHNKGGTDNYSYYLEYNEETNTRIVLICGGTGMLVLIVLFIVIGWICWRHKVEDAKNYPPNVENMQMNLIHPNKTPKQRKRSKNNINAEATYIRADRVDSYYTDMPQMIPRLDSKSRNSSEFLNGRFADTSREVNKLLRQTTSECHREHNDDNHEVSKLLRQTASECPQEYDVSKQNKDGDVIVLPKETYETIEQWFRKSDPLNADIFERTMDNISQNSSITEDIDLENALKIFKRNSNYMYDAIENEDGTVKMIHHEDIYDNEDINNNMLADKQKFNEFHSNFLINEMITASVEHLNRASGTALLSTDSTKSLSQSRRYSEANIFEECSSTDILQNRRYSDANICENSSNTNFQQVTMREQDQFYYQSKEVIDETINLIKSKHNNFSDRL